MKNDSKKGTKLAALATGAVALSAFGLNANPVALESTDLGSAGELRAELLGDLVPTGFVNNADVELKCGEGKCGEGKCGESKSGDKKAEKKEEKKTEGKSETKEKKESKGSEGKCGEGKCGEGKCGTH